MSFNKDLQYYKFCFYGFFKNLRFFEPFMILFLLEKGLGFLEIGILYSIREILRNIFEIPSGVIADILGRRKTLVQSFVFYIISFILFFFSNSFEFLAVAMGVFAFGDAFRTGTNKAMIISYLKQHGWEHQKVHYYGHTRSYSQLGSAISSLIAAAIVFSSGTYSIVFLCSVIPYLIDLILVASYPKSLDGTSKREQGIFFKHLLKAVYSSFIQSFKQSNSIRSILNLSIHTGYYKASKDYLQPLLVGIAITLPITLSQDENRQSAIIIGVSYFVIYLLSSMATRYSGKISERFKHPGRGMNFTGLIGYIAGGVAGFLFYLDFQYLSILPFILIFLIENLRKPIGISQITELMDKKILSTSLSVESQTNSLVAAIVAPLLGWLADSYSIGIALISISLLMIFIYPLYRIRSGSKAKN
jgi:MFS family permease